MDDIFGFLAEYIEQQIRISESYLGTGVSDHSEYRALCGGISAMKNMEKFLEDLKGELSKESIG